MTRHRCPITGCATTVPRGRLMCAVHWRLVPPALRRAVVRAWRAVRDAPIRDRPRLVEAVRAHQQAKRAAVEAVNELEANPR